MSQRVVYVGGLPHGTSDYELRDIFGTYGNVASANVVRCNHSGNSAGYRFVELTSGEQALRAIASLDGAAFHGKSLRLFIMPYASTRTHFCLK